MLVFRDVCTVVIEKKMSRESRKLCFQIRVCHEQFEHDFITWLAFSVEGASEIKMCAPSLFDSVNST